MQFQLAILASKLGEVTTEVQNALPSFGDWKLLVIGIVLIVAAIAIFMFLKNIIANSIAGIIVWAIVVYAFGIQLSFWPSLIVSAIFGLAGIGALLILNFLGIKI